MILGRLLVREKLNLLVALPISLVVLVAVPVTAGQVASARQAGATVRLMTATGQVGALVEQVESESALSISYLAAPSARPGPVAAQQAAVRNGVYQVRSALGGQLPAGLDQALAKLDALGPLRASVLDRSASPETVSRIFGGVVVSLIDALGLDAPGVPPGSGPATLDALMRGDEESADADSLLLAAAADPAARGPALAAATGEAEQAHNDLDQFRVTASPGQVAMVDFVDNGSVATAVAGYLAHYAADPAAFDLAADAHDALVVRLLAAVQAQESLRQLVQDRVVQDVATQAQVSADNARAAAVGFTGAAVLVLVLLGALTLAVGRSIAGPLGRLAHAAGQVADLAQAELVRVADDERSASPPRLAAIDLSSQDEIGELAAAINRVQASAALLLERQVVIRHNVADMFGNIGRRTQNLVGRQHALIDELERNEANPELLQIFYRLDHLTSRLRRKANSLVVLSGSVDLGSAATPAPLLDVMRSALGETEDYRRTRIHDLDGLLVAAGARRDLALLFAELLDNAVAFSPPNAQVEVWGERGADGYRVWIADHGIGMTQAQLEAVNVRLQGRERLDLMPTDVLGLFVVGRLCRRLGTTVVFTETSGGGITATVSIPRTLEALDRAQPAAGGSARDGRAWPAPAPGGPARDGRPWSPPAAVPAAVPALTAPDQFDEDPDFVLINPLRTALAAVVPDVEFNAGPLLADGGAPVDGSRHGLVRRVPGSQFPGMAPAAVPEVQTWADPEAARSLAVQFQDGAHRALRASEPREGLQAPSPRTDPHPARRVESWTPERVDPLTTSTVRQIASEVRRELDNQGLTGANRADVVDEEFDWLTPRSAIRAHQARPGQPAGAEAGQPAAAGPAPAPPGADGLRRRVPGAGLPWLNQDPQQPQAPQQPRAAVGDMDAAAAARALVEAVDEGFARARQAIRKDDDYRNGERL